MNVGIIGLGEVGKAMQRLCEKKHRVFGRNRTRDELRGKEVDVLHLCFPYTADFIEIAVKNIKELKPKLIIIDSTVKPGTTQEIFNRTKIPIVHAPIIGKHPHLYQYLFAMEKIIGPVNEQAYRLAKKHFSELGLKVVRFRSPLESEMAKLFCTTYYGWNIIFEKYVHEICRSYGANFNEVYEKLNQIYNRGYARTFPWVRRPILKHQDGAIGGHCVIPNALIINGWLHDELSKFLLNQNEKYKKEEPAKEKK